MKTEDFVYATETSKSFEDAVVSVLKAAEQKGWTLFQIYDVKERLAAKGFSQKPLKIIELCSGKYANPLLNKNRLTSLCIPCRINVFENDNGNVKIAVIKPTMIPTLFPEISQNDVKEIEKEVMEIVASSR